MNDGEPLEGLFLNVGYTGTYTNTDFDDGNDLSYSVLESEDSSPEVIPDLPATPTKPRRRVKKLVLIAGVMATMAALSLYGYRLFPTVREPEEMEEIEHPTAPAEGQPRPSTDVPREAPKKKKSPRVEVKEKEPPKVEPEEEPPFRREPSDIKPTFFEPEKIPPEEPSPAAPATPEVRPGTRGDGSISESMNKSQWQLDIERSREISASDGKWDPVPLNEDLKNQQEKAARASLAAVVQEFSKPSEQKFTAEQQEQIQIAQEILLAHGGKGSKKAIVVKGFRSSLGSEDGEDDTVEFEVKGVLGATDLGVTFEVEPKDEKIKKLLGGKPLSMKIAIQGLKDDATEATVANSANFLSFSVDTEKEILNKLRLKDESAQETIERTGVVAPTFCANLQVEEEIGKADGGIFHKQLLFSPILKADFQSVANQQRLKGGLTSSQKVFVVKRMLKALGHVHAAGLLHNDLKLDKFVLDEEGNLFLTDFAIAAGIGRERKMWSNANGAPEQVKEFRDNASMTGTEKGEGWAVGLAAFLALADKAPFEWSRKDSYLMKLFNGDKEVLSPHFDVTHYPSPAFALQKLNIPEELVSAVTALLQPEDKNRATVRQVLNHFPQLFE